MPFLGRSPDIGAISDNSVTSAKIVNATIVEADLADDAVTTAKIADDAITSALIADDAVTAAKIADSVSLGAYNSWAVKTGTYTAANKDQLIANSGSAFTITLPAGTAGQVKTIFTAVQGGSSTVTITTTNVLPAVTTTLSDVGDSWTGWYDTTASKWQTISTVAAGVGS